MRSESKGEPLFFAGTEIVAFLFLFLSPLLSSESVYLGFLALVLWKTAAVGSVLYYGAPGGWGFLLRSLLYGLPFWLSALLFSLKPGQEHVLQRAFWTYLSLQLGLALLSRLPTQWFPALMGGLTFGFLYQDTMPLPWMGASVVLIVFLRRGKQDRRGLEADSLFLVSLLVCAGWALSLLLAVSNIGAGLEPLALALLYWLVLVGASTDVLTFARHDDESRDLDREVELSLPGLFGARVWRYTRWLYRTWMPWLFVIVWATWKPLGILLGLMVALAMPGLVGLAARVSGEVTLQRFVCWQFALLWGVAESPGLYRIAWLPIAAVSAFLLYRAQPKSSSPSLQLCPCQGQIEKRLRQELHQQGPPDFAQEVIRHLEPSIEFDDSLATVAPKGFSSRLLERLRRTED